MEFTESVNGEMNEEFNMLNKSFDQLCEIKRWLSGNPFGQDKTLTFAEEDLNNVILKFIAFKNSIA